MRFKWFAFAGALISAAGALAVGCGLDDSVITQLGDSVDGSLADGAQSNDAGLDTGPPCTPYTTASCATIYPSDCHGALPDKCGGTIDCRSACPTGQDCISDAGAGVDLDAAYFCNGPPPCIDAGESGGSCGTLVNQHTLQSTVCGSCLSGGDTCEAGVCCTMLTCAGAYPGLCFPNNDNGCGGNVNCSAACTTAGQACAPDDHCDTTPVCNNNGQPGGNCGTLTSTHGLTATCSGCSNGYTCATNICTCTSAKTCGTSCCGASTDVCNGTTCCTPNAMATTCMNKCGTVTDNCGQSVNCGNCGTNDVCSGTCTCGSGGDTDTCSNNQICCHGVHYYCHTGGSCP